jgi:hypothetical protein
VLLLKCNIVPEARHREGRNTGYRANDAGCRIQDARSDHELLYELILFRGKRIEIEN